MLREAPSRSGPRDRLPLRRPVGRGRDGAPERDERAWPASVAALVLVRPRAAGTCAEGLGWKTRERRSGAACVLPPRQDEQCGANRDVRAGDGKGAGDRLADELAAGADDQPLAAELGHVLTEDLTRLAVAHVVVERTPGVRELKAPVAPLRRPDQLRPDAVSGHEGATLVIDGPGLRASAVAGASPVLVLRERVEHKAAPVEQDLAVGGPFRLQRRRR